MYVGVGVVFVCGCGSMGVGMYVGVGVVSVVAVTGYECVWYLCVGVGL